MARRNQSEEQRGLSTVQPGFDGRGRTARRLPINAWALVARRALQRVRPLLSLCTASPEPDPGLLNAAIQILEYAAALSLRNRTEARQLKTLLCEAADRAMAEHFGHDDGSAAEDDAEIVYLVFMSAACAVDAVTVDAWLGETLIEASFAYARAAWTLGIAYPSDAGMLQNAVESDVEFLALLTARWPKGRLLPLEDKDVGVLWPSGEPRVMESVRKGR